MQWPYWLWPLFGSYADFGHQSLQMTIAIPDHLLPVELLFSIFLQRNLYALSLVYEIAHCTKIGRTVHCYKVFSKEDNWHPTQSYRNERSGTKSQKLDSMNKMIGSIASPSIRSAMSRPGGLVYRRLFSKQEGVSSKLKHCFEEYRRV